MVTDMPLYGYLHATVQLVKIIYYTLRICKLDEDLDSSQA